MSSNAPIHRKLRQQIIARRLQIVRDSVAIVEILEQRVFLSGTQAGTIFVATEANNTSIGEYSTSGQTLNASLISGVGEVDSLTGSGSDLFFTNGGDGSVHEYTTSGQYVNSFEPYSAPGGIAISGSKIFVTDDAGYLPYATPGGVSEFTITGSTVKDPVIGGLDNPTDVAVSGSDLFVADNSDNIISEYTTSGQLVKRNFISGVLNPLDIAVSGSDLFVVDGGWIGEYTTSGKTVNAHLIPAGSPAIAVLGSDIFFTTDNGVAEYTTSGKPVNTNLISGLDSPSAIYVTGDQSSAPSAPSIVPTLGKVTLPTSATSGKKMHAKVPVSLANQGSAIKGKVNIDLYANTTSSLDGNQVFISSVQKNVSLKSGKTTNIQCTISSLPSTLPAGTYHILADIVDPSGGESVLATSQTVEVAPAAIR